MISSAKCAIRVITAEHLLGNGIKSALRSENYEIVDDDDDEAHTDIIIICADARNCIPDRICPLIVRSRRRKSSSWVIPVRARLYRASR